MVTQSYVVRSECTVKYECKKNLKAPRTLLSKQIKQQATVILPSPRKFHLVAALMKTVMHEFSSVLEFVFVRA